MKNNVKVLAKDGQELMPTTIEKANKLIAKGEAEIVENSPLVIKMLKETKRYKQDSFEKEVEYEKNPYLIPLGKKYSEENGLEPLYWDVKNSKNYLFCSHQEDMLTNFNDLLVEHISNNDNYHMIIANPMITNSLNYAGAKNTSIISNLYELQYASEVIYSIMMDRFRYLEQARMTKIDKLDVILSKISINGKTYNWDDVILVHRSTSEFIQERNFSRISAYKNIVVLMTAREIYETLMKDENICLEMVNYYRGQSRYITKGSIAKIQATEKYEPKDIILCINDPKTYMVSDDYYAVDKIKSNIGNIIRLGKTVGIQVAFVANYIGGSAINTNMVVNIENKTLVGNFNAGISSIMFEKILVPKEESNLGYTGKWGLVDNVKLNISNKDFNFDIDSILTQTNNLYLENNEGNLEGFSNEDVPIKKKTVKRKKEQIRENIDENYDYLTLSEIRERLMTQVNTIEKQIVNLKEDINNLLNEFKDLIE